MNNETSGLTLRSGRVAPCSEHQKLFLDRYDQFRRWAALIARQDKDLADDILHDTYLKFASSARPAESLDDYVFVSLKNQYVSHLRRDLRLRRAVSLSDGVIAQSRYFSVDPRPANRVVDKLRAICHYACVRRSTSIGASILILRFFHGYSADEVVRIVRRSPNAVESRLAMARREVNTFLAFPQKLAWITKKNSALFSGSYLVGEGPHIQTELRGIVFANRSGECMPSERIEKFYRSQSGELPKADLAHLVACEPCLRRIGDVLQIPWMWDAPPKKLGKSSRQVSQQRASL